MRELVLTKSTNQTENHHGFSEVGENKQLHIASVKCRQTHNINYLYLLLSKSEIILSNFFPKLSPASTKPVALYTILSSLSITNMVGNPDTSNNYLFVAKVSI